MHVELLAMQYVLVAVHLLPAQQVPKLSPQVMQLPWLHTVSTVIADGASHWPPSAMHIPPSSPAE
jgi:hypothetical protein